MNASLRLAPILTVEAPNPWVYVDGAQIKRAPRGALSSIKKRVPRVEAAPPTRRTLRHIVLEVSSNDTNQLTTLDDAIEVIERRLDELLNKRLLSTV